MVQEEEEMVMFSAPPSFPVAVEGAWRYDGIVVLSDEEDDGGR